MESRHGRVNLDKARQAYEAGRNRRQQNGHGSVTLRATASLVKDAYLEGRIGRFHFNCDEPPERGGDDQAPSPLEYFLIGAVF